MSKKVLVVSAIEEADHNSLVEAVLLMWSRLEDTVNGVNDDSELMAKIMSASKETESVTSKDVRKMACVASMISIVLTVSNMMGSLVKRNRDDAVEELLFLLQLGMYKVYNGTVPRLDIPMQVDVTTVTNSKNIIDFSAAKWSGKLN